MKTFTIVALCLVALTGIVRAADDVRNPGEIITTVSRVMTYQGILKDNSGEPVGDGAYNLTFRLYDAENDGTLLWASPVTQIQTANGYFTAELGPINLAFDATYYLSVQVQGDSEMSQRQKLTAGAYALRGDSADVAIDIIDNSISSAKIVDGTISLSDIGQNGATSGKVIKWNGSAWVAGDDSIGGAGNWTVSGDVIYTNSQWGIARGSAGNVLSGSVNTMVNLGVACSTSSSYSVIGGGQSNVADADWSTVGGGYSNVADAGWSTVGGGQSNIADGSNSVVSGGFDNSTENSMGVVAGGAHNRALGNNNVVSGGYGNVVDGGYSVIPGGYRDTVNADNSMAFGNRVYLATDDRVAFFRSGIHGCLGLNRDDRDGGINYPIHVGTSVSNGNGAYLSSGGVWTNGSSRTFKENFTPFDGNELLSKISNLSVTTYNYKSSTEKHVGPVAEEFVQAFDTGVIRESDGKRDDQYLAASDVAGVALAGVQELLKKIETLEKRIAELEAAQR